MGMRLMLPLAAYLLFSCSAPQSAPNQAPAAAPSSSAATAPPGAQKPPWPRREFPDSVAGFQFGISVERFAELCKAAGFEPVHLDATAAAGCTGAASPMPFEVDHVLVYICSGRACEYAVTTKPGAPEATHVLAVLEEHYGKALNTEYSPRCQADPPSTRHVWAWRGASADRMSFLRLMFDCDAGKTPAERAATLFYDNEDGAEWRRQQRQRQDVND